ncbi:electron transfer flavoprotein subunit beta/FixA family protein [Arthrobacter sp. MMS18-M83]|uniref:electron transfer flavoprotein subunit beta/FixA family protein n=1 Tax=Arthrobacter sp. MMS18-M83 TaxID=2996261 RepID=UPI00227BC0D1|nr:electron transfer flavoprotein subunit beta/FixA family protein [Arthrobacter sp. MMS18-M83]WAH96294.1 electron transfer flavoprotein subunit beta/FixA family protein [Arthrobacter sp. MMS18-M83]
MRSVVLVKQVPDAYGRLELDSLTGLLDRNSGEQAFDEITERALEVALQQREAHGGDVVVLSMGPAQATDALRKALAMGADSGVHVLDDALSGSDAIRTSEVLAAALRRIGFDLAIAGDRSSDGQGGVVPAMIAEHLGVAQATYLSSLDTDGQSLTGERITESGTQAVRAVLPAMVSVTEKIAEPRYPNFLGIMKAKKKPVQVWTTVELGMDEGTPAGSRITSVAERPPREAGVRIVDDGTAGRQLARFLSKSGLV